MRIGSEYRGFRRYKVTDFVRVGLPLTLIVYGLAIVLVPLIWPV